MKRLAALCGALVLTLALAAPAAADQKVWIPEVSGKDAWVAEVSTSNADWWYWEGWACSKPIWYAGDFKHDLWLWYPNDVAAADMKPVGEAWPWTKGMARTKGTDTYASNRNFSGRVLRNKLRLTERMYDHRVNGNIETWKVQLAGKDFNLTAPGAGPIFKSVGNWRYTVTYTLPDGPMDFSDFVKHGPEEFYDLDALCDYFDAGPVLYAS